MKKGDSVRINCEGPEMVIVSDVEPKSETVGCVWFDREGHLQAHTFPRACIMVRVERGAEREDHPRGTPYSNPFSR